MTPSGVVNVTIQSNISEFPTEKRYDPNIKVSELKKKLELITGATHSTMRVTLAVDDKEVGLLKDDDETFGHYLGNRVTNDSSVKLIVEDENSSLNLSGDAPKFVISEDKYLQRPNNARNFIKEMRDKRLSGQSNGGGQ